MKTKLFTICILLFTSQLSAESQFTWEHITTSNDGGSTFYGDKNSIRKNSSGNYIVWVLVNNKTGKYEGESRIISQEHDCAQLRYRWVFVEAYRNHYGKGEEYLSMDTEEIKSLGYYKWRYPKPNSNEYHQVNWVCQN